MSSLPWLKHKFTQLNCKTLYDIMRLRVDVFIVEQTCYYHELDDLDHHPETLHIYAYEGETLLGYLRCLAPGVVYDNESTIGRVVIAPQARGRHLGHSLIKQGIEVCEQTWPNNAIHLSGQAHLQNYYNQHGFATCSNIYLEDGIPHIGMIRKVQKTA